MSLSGAWHIHTRTPPPYQRRDLCERMLEHIADFTAWPILTGIFIGYIANRIMSGEGKGCCMNLIIGIIGSYAGTFISHLLDIELLGKGYLTNFVFCVVGAITVLWIWKKLFD